MCMYVTAIIEILYTYLYDLYDRNSHKSQLANLILCPNGQNGISL